MTRLPCSSAGTNGNGGQLITLAIVVSSSGAASAAATNPATVSAVAGRTSRPPTTWSTSCRRKRNRVATPKLPPPPRMAQNRSGCDLLVDPQHLPVGSHDVGRQQAVDGQPVLAGQVAHAAAESQPAEADGAGVPEAHGQAVSAGRLGELSGGQAGLCPGRAARHIDVDGRHVPQVEHDAAVDDGVGGGAVPAAAHCERQTRLTGQRDGPHDVRIHGRPHDQGRSGLEPAVGGHAGVVVPLVVRSEQAPLELRTEVRHGKDPAGGGRRHQLLPFLDCRQAFDMETGMQRIFSTPGGSVTMKAAATDSQVSSAVMTNSAGTDSTVVRKIESRATTTERP